MKKITIELEKPFVPSSLQQCKHTPDTLCTTVKDILEALQPLYKPVMPNRIDFTEDDWENAEHITPAELDTLAAKHITYLSKLIEMCKAALLGIQQNKSPTSALAGLGPTAVCQIMHVCLVAYEHLLLAPKLKDALAQQKYIVESNAIALVSGMLSLGLLDAASALCMRIRRSLACREKIKRSKETRISHGKDDTPALAEIVIKLLYLETQCIFARHGPYEQVFASYESEWTEWMHFYKKSATEKCDEYEKRFRGLVTKNVSKAFTYGSTPPCTLEDAQKLVNILACVSSTNQGDFFGIAIKWERETKRDGRSLYISTAKAAKRAGLLPIAGASTSQQFCENYVFWCAACMQSFARNHTNKSGSNEDISFAEQVYSECSAYIARYREQPLFYSALIGVCAADLHVSEGGATKLKEAEDTLNGAARKVLDNTEALKKFTKTQIIHIKWALYALRKNIKSKCRPFVPNGVIVPKGLLSGFGVAMYGLAKVALLVPRGNSEGNNTVNAIKNNDSNNGSNGHRTLGPRYEWFEHASLAIKSFFAAGEYNELRRVAKFVHRHSPFTNEKNDDNNEKKPDGASEDTQVARLAFILLRSHGVALHNEREYTIAADLLSKSVDILRKQHPQVQADNNLDEAYLFAAASRQALGGDDNLSAALGGYAASVVCNLRFRRAQPPKSAVERYMRLCTTAFPRDVSKVILLLDSVARAENNNVGNNKEWVLCVSKIQLGVCRDMCLPFSFHLCILNHVINTTYASGRMKDYAAALVSKALINRTLQLARRKTFPENDAPCALLRRAISSVFSSNTNDDSDEDYEGGDNTKVNKAAADNDETLLCTLAEAHTWLGICTLERRLKPSDVPRKSSFVTDTNLSELLDGADDALHYLHHGLYLWKVLSEHLYGIASNKNSDSAVQLPSPEQLQAIQYLVDVFAVLGDFQAQIEAATCGIHFAETVLSQDPQTWVQPGCNVQMSRNNVITALVNIRLSLARTYDMFGRHAVAERAITMAESDAAPLSEEGGTSTTTTTFDRDSAFCSNIRLYILAGRLRHNTSIYGVHHHHHDSKNGDVRKLFCEADLALRELSSRVDVCKTWGAYVIRSELEHAVASALLLHGRPDDAQAAATASLDHKLRVSAVVMPGLASSGPAAGTPSSSAQSPSAEATDQLLGEVRFRPYASDWRVLEGASESLAQLAAINVVQEALSAANVAMLRGAALGAATAIPRLYWLHVQEVAELESRRGNADTCEKYAGLLEPALKKVRGKQALGQSPEYAVYERRLGDFAKRAGRPAAETLEWYRKAKSTLEGSMKVGTIQRRADTMKRAISTPQRSVCTDAALEDAFIESFKYHSPPAKKVCLRLSGVDDEDRGSFPINSVDTIKAEITCCEADLRKADWSKKESVDNEDLSEEAEDAIKKMVEKAAKERIRPDIRAKLRLIHASLLTRKGSRKNACKVAKDAYEKALLSQREPLLLHKAATLYAEAKCLALKDTLFTDDDSEITDIAFLLNAAQGVSFCQQMARQEEEREEEEEEDEDDEEDKMNSDDDSGECSGIHRRHQLRARFLAKTPGRHIASRVAQEVKGRKRKSFRRNADKYEKRRISLFDMFAGENRRNFLTRYVDSLPKEWTIVSVTQVDTGLLITRLRPGCRAVVKVAATRATTTEKLVSELRNFVTKNRDTAVAAAETDTDKMSWSAVRGSLNNEMRRFISRIEDTVLGSVKALLVGPYCEPIVEAALCAQVDELLQKNGWMPVRNPRVRDVLLLVMNAMPYLTQSDIKYWASMFVDASFCPGMEEANTSALAQDLSDFHSAALANAFRVAKKAGCLGSAYASVPDQKEAHTSWAKSLSRGPVILVLDRAVQELPWESIPCLAAHPVTRVPSIAFAAALGSSITQQHEDESGEIDDIFTPQTPRNSHHRSRYAEDDEASGTSTEKDDGDGGMAGVIPRHRANRGIVQNGVCMDKVLYILDPKQNLPVLVEEMRPVVEANPKWVGTISAPPPPAHELRDQAARADIFMYCGHGSGETYLPSNEIAALPDATAPVAMLMGCSSSKLFDNGDFEPTGAPTHWLCAGSPAVIGFLWEATDKNADTLTQALLSFWTGIAPMDRHKTPQMKQEEGTDGVESANSETQTTSLPEALARARQRCSFEYLIGAAAVYYGVPVYCKKLSSDVAATLSAATSSAFRRKSKSRIPVKEKGRKNPYLTPYTARSSRILCCSKSDSGMTEDLPLQKQ